MAKIVIHIEAEISGIPRTKLLEDLSSDFEAIVDEAVEGADYFLQDPDSDKEYDSIEVSVTSVKISKA
jgi:hypothetical protein